MTDEATGGQAPQEGQGGQVPPQQGSAQGAQHADAGGNGEGTADTFPRQYVEELRRESAGYRTRAQQAETQLEQTQKASGQQLTEAMNRATAAEQRLNELTVANALVAEAARMGFHDPEDAVRLADIAQVELKEGRVQGVEDVLKALATKKPHLLKGRATGDAGASGTGGATKGMNEAIRAAAGRRS
jgi:hypothetical protein